MHDIDIDIIDIDIIDIDSDIVMQPVLQSWAHVTLCPKTLGTLTHTESQCLTQGGWIPSKRVQKVRVEQS